MGRPQSRASSAHFFLVFLVAVVLSSKSSVADSKVLEFELIRNADSLLHFAQELDPLTIHGALVRSWLEEKAQFHRLRGTESFLAVKFEKSSAQTHLRAANGLAVKAFADFTQEGIIEYPVTHSVFTHPYYAHCQASPEVNLDGICGVLAALHSLVKLGRLAEGDVKDEKGNFRRKILIEAKGATGAPGVCGTTSEQEEKIYKYFSDGEVDCEPTEPLTNGSLGDKCKKLRQKLDAGYDCKLSMLGKDFGHAMHATSATPLGPNNCSISVLDTTQQGDGDGNEVPGQPQRQRFSLSQNTSILSGKTYYTDRYAQGPDAMLWESVLRHSKLNYAFRCCK